MFHFKGYSILDPEWRGISREHLSSTVPIIKIWEGGQQIFHSAPQELKWHSPKDTILIKTCMLPGSEELDALYVHTYPELV